MPVTAPHFILFRIILTPRVNILWCPEISNYSNLSVIRKQPIGNARTHARHLSHIFGKSIVNLNVRVFSGSDNILSSTLS